MPRSGPSPRRRVAYTVLLLVLPFAVLALIEGTASLAILARSLIGSRHVDESHTEPDTLLGWINIPNFDQPDFYTGGVGFRTNSQRFRHRGEVAPKPPDGRRRVVCSGDSFTLGFGVDDPDTWCARLAALNPSLETVNLGQSAYGIDQAYLWYLRDGLPLHPDLHLFAFVWADFHRMVRTEFNGYPKPQLARDGDSVRATGVPVRRPGLGPLWSRVTSAFRSLSSFEVLQRLQGARSPSADAVAIQDSIIWDLAHAALRDLARRDSAAGIALTVVFLPQLQDFRSGSAGKWRRLLHAAAERGEFALLDLIEPFQHLPADSAEALFIQDGELSFRGAAGHYNRAGNAWAANQLRRLLPALSEPKTPVP